MKIMASIFLPAILLFNLCGYRLLTSLLERRASLQMETALNDNRYEESEMISIKVPAKHISPYSNSTPFVRVDGQIEISGIQYNYIKRRLCNDSIEMLCIPNHKATQIKKNSLEFYQLTNDLQQPGHGKKPGLQKNFSGDYFATLPIFKIDNLTNSLSKKTSFYSETIPPAFSIAVERPPDKLA